MNRTIWIAVSATLLLAGCNDDDVFISEGICAGFEPSQQCSLGLTNANIELDPFLTAPLSARLSFTTPVSGTTRVTVLGKDAAGLDIAHTFEDAATEFVLPVLGLYPEFQNSVVIEFFDDVGDSTKDVLTVTTGPVTAPVFELIQNSLPADDTGLILFASQKAGFDQQGNVRWSYTGESNQFYTQLPNGNLLGIINDAPILYHYPKFGEFTLLGEKVREYSVANYAHHELVKLPSGNFLVGSNSALINSVQDGVPEEDVFVEIDADTGSIVKTFDFNQILDPTRPPIPSNNRPDDWLHLNSAVFDESDQSIIVTAQRQSLMAKIDYETGALKWILSAHEQWPLELQDKLLAPVDSNGDPVDPNTVDFWPYGPHGALTFGDGRVSLFDNGAYRGWYGDPDSPAASYSRAVEYQVDEVNMEVQIVWQFDAGKTLFTSSRGDLDYLESGNYLVGFTGPGDIAPRVIEVTLAGDIVFEAVSNRSVPDYRVEKIDLYRGN